MFLLFLALLFVKTFSLTVENTLEISTCPLGFAARISKNLRRFRFSGGQNLITNSLGLLGDTYSGKFVQIAFPRLSTPLRTQAHPEAQKSQEQSWDFLFQGLSPTSGRGSCVPLVASIARALAYELRGITLQPFLGCMTISSFFLL